MADPDYDVPGIGPIKFIDRSVDNYFRRTNIVYGASGTGKSTIVYWLCDILKARMPNILVINPSEDGNGAYRGRVPARCVHRSPTADYLRSVFNRQKAATIVYNEANDLKLLESLVRRDGDSAVLRQTALINDKANTCIHKVQEDATISQPSKDSIIDEIKEMRDNNIRNLYKRCIVQNKSRLVGMDLSEDEKMAIKYLHFNPSLLLILDDCASEVKEWARDPILAKLFFEARHWWITSIYTMQDDKKLHPEIRKNGFNSFFTTPATANGFFTSKANAFDKDIITYASRIAAEVFRPNLSGERNFKKMAYCRMDAVNPFRYLQAEASVLRPFRMGADSLWRLCDAIPEDHEAKGRSRRANPAFVAFTTE